MFDIAENSLLFVLKKDSLFLKLCSIYADIEKKGEKMGMIANEE